MCDRISDEIVDLFYREAESTGLDPAQVRVACETLATTNRVGQQVYSRSGLTSTARFQRNCARYASPDLAQEAFLAAGGPERDRRGLDPDGDGFACFWDPTPFRMVRGG